MAIAEITVLGAGIFGLSIAYECARRGARVQVIDPHGPGAGSSGGVVGALAPHTPDGWNAKKQFQFESLAMAAGFWRGVAEVSGQDPGYRQAGRLQQVPDPRALDLARAREGSARDTWQGRFDWRVVPAEGYRDWLVPAATGFSVLDTLSARLHPRLASAALCAAIEGLGGRVVTEGATEGAVIEATGVAGLEELSQAMGRVIGNGVKGQAALLRCAADDRPQIYADGLHIVPHSDGTVGVGSTSERDYADPSATDDQLEQVIHRARAICPLLREAPVIERWAALRPRAKSRAPMLGTHPLRPDRLIANGGFKIGFGMAPKVAQVMADLALEGAAAIPAAFRPEASL